MVLRMIAYAMTLKKNRFIDSRLRHHIFSKAKKCRFGVILFKLFKNKWCCSGVRPIIKCDEDLFSINRNLPGITREKKSPNEPGRFHQVKHNWLFSILF